MTESDRLERLEQRVATLEALVRRLAADASAAQPAPPRAREIPPLSSPTTAPPSARPARRTPRLPLVTETWIGERGLLAVGVTALVLAAAYLLKLSFERGWVSPLMRCLMGLAGGGVVGVIGARLHARYRIYGAALVGCGAAIIYLAVWAAGTRYALVAPLAAISGLVLVSLMLAAIAARLDVEALGATAALGAFFAPITIETGARNADVLLVFLFCIGAALGAVSARRRWRLAALVIAASYFGLGVMAAEGAAPLGAMAFGALGGTAGLYLGLREGWWETRAISFAGGWSILYQAAEAGAPGMALLAASLVLAGPVWWQALRQTQAGADVRPHRRGFEWPASEAVYFLVTPVLLAWAVERQAPAWFEAHPGILPLLIAAPYLAAGYSRVRPAFAAIGVAATGIALWTGLEPVASAVGLSLLALGTAALDWPLGRTDGRWLALGALWAALGRIGDAAGERPGTAPAFVDAWAGGFWSATGTAAALAAGLWRRVPEDRLQGVRAALWAVAGGLLLFGVTGELGRLFRQQIASADAARLSGGLAVSAWWLLCAAALVAIGFGRSIGSVRKAGLAVAAAAVAKVVLVDLAGLDALYRVGSVLILGCVSLGIAYLYHRHARAAGAQP